ncbi:probable linoleate 9S-lipoxygenase 5 [Diospyros lotus]|uniref:probable linoleate 9S-lipoxygenase 5 n=1 Tax=Diospyros lotus TaxID=55363 RepID=UPI0022540659|nr:probable linoleate 9S-lipoxygenase 5 [Diospyros lotus]
MTSVQFAIVDIKLRSMVVCYGPFFLLTKSLPINSSSYATNPTSLTHLSILLLFFINIILQSHILPSLTRMDPISVTDQNSKKKIKHEGAEMEKIKGSVVLMKKNLLDFSDLVASAADRFDEIRGNKVSLQLVSAVNGDPENGNRGKVGKPAYLEDWFTKFDPLTAADVAFNITFEWNEEEIGLPGAFIIKNSHHNEFYLRTLTLEDVPGHGRIHFICNSWVYPHQYYKKDRVFFTNQTYLPSKTPSPLRHYREEELKTLRGNGTGKLEEWDRVYDYDLYNDLSEPEKGPKLIRPILGGSTKYPYPRRGRTGRPPAEADPRYESRIPLLKSLNIYVPRDERFSHLKFSDVLAYGLKSLFQFLLPEVESIIDSAPNEFDKLEDILDLYEAGIKLPDWPFLESIRKNIPSQTLKEILRTDGERAFRFPVPLVIKEDKHAWRTDEEFAREMLAGLNPVVIHSLREFPPSSKLNPKSYNNEGNTKTKENIEKNLEGLTIDEALKENKLFILDYHNVLMPYLRGINKTSTKLYATRTLLFLKSDGTLRPLAIELSLPNPVEDDSGEVSEVYTPAEHGAEGTIWQLAKAYVAVSDSGYHQLICHWLNTHASIEPFIIATNRNLSVLHPIHKLLHPHFRDTMHVNALARQTLINAGGLLEKTLFPSKYAMEMTAVAYRDWTFPEQALPADLVKRGMAVEDSKSPHGVRLLVEDYPYAVDGLEIWSAIKTWVEDYCRIYYATDDKLLEDSELQTWWKELREKGHADKKDEPWWPKMQTRKELVETCTIIIWVASALHAALNFGQYPYGGYLPNRPAMSRRFIPKQGTPEYDELESDPEKAFLKTVTPQMLSILGISLVEILSRHTSDEVFLGKRDTAEWTADKEAVKAFGEFGENLAGIEDRIIRMNIDEKWRNRVGPAKMPYTLLIPTSGVGLTGRGIPNSVSI